MRRLSKLKPFFSLNFENPFVKIPLRILKCKRPKWNNLKKKINKGFKKKQLYTNLSKQKVLFKPFFRVRNSFRQDLIERKLWYLFFNRGVGVRQMTQYKQKKDLKTFYLIKNIYKLDILLYHINFSKSVYHSKHQISNKKIRVNNKSVYSNYILKKGDIINFTFNKTLLKTSGLEQIVKTFNKSKMFVPFLMFDHYTKSIVITKNINELFLDDFKLIY